MEKKSNKVAAILTAVGVAIAGVAVGGIGGALIADDNAQVVALQEQIAALNVTAEPVIVTKFVDKEVIVEVPVNVTVEKIVEVDNGNMELVIEDYEGEDLDADEIADIVDTVIFKNDVSTLAENLVKSDIVAFMDDENMFRKGVLKDYRDDDVYSVTVDEDETSIEDVDFDDKDAAVFVEYKLKLNDDGDKLKVTYIAEIEVRDNELEIVSVELVE